MISLKTMGRILVAGPADEDDGQRGFTLVEMLVVITIIGLIMGLIGPRVLNYLSESKVKAAKIQLQSFGSALDLFYRTSLFCRNLGVLLGSGVNLTATLRILVDIMAVTGGEATWAAAADRVRHGGKLSDALSAASSLPPMAVRMLRLGEETGQLPALAARVAEFYEAKLQRSLDRIVGIVGPLAIVTISTVVGGLIVSVMTALLSVTQLVG